MKKEPTYKEIGEHLGKSENTIKGWKQKFPKLLKVVKLGVVCETNNIDLEALDKMIEVKEMFELVESIKSAQENKAL